MLEMKEKGEKHLGSKHGKTPRCFSHWERPQRKTPLLSRVEGARVWSEKESGDQTLAAESLLGVGN